MTFDLSVRNSADDGVRVVECCPVPIERIFRSMLERGDLLALHEPLEGLAYIGPTEIDQHQFETPESLIAWLLDHKKIPVFLKETCSRPALDVVCADRRFLTEVRHAFLIRRPEEIAASFYALEHDMRIQETECKDCCPQQWFPQ